MSRLPPVAFEEMPAALQEAATRGRSSGLLSTTLPVQVWAHRPAVALAWLQALDAIHSQGLLPARLRELMRLRIAAITNCQACQMARKSDEVSEADIACLATDDPRFSDDERAALRYAELFAGDHTAIDDTTFDALKRCYTVPQIVEINLFCALMLAGGRMTYAQRAYGETPA